MPRIPPSAYGPPTAGPVILLNRGCCPCPQSCGCAGLYEGSQYYQGPGVTDAQALPFRRLPFAKFDFTLTRAPPDCHVYYATADNPTVLIRETVNFTPLVGAADTLTLDAAAYNASYPVPATPARPTLKYVGSNWYTDGTFVPFFVPPGYPRPSVYPFEAVIVWHDFVLASGRKVAAGFAVEISCQSTGQASNAFSVAGGFPGFEVANLRDGTGNSVPTYPFLGFYWMPIALHQVGLLVLRALEDFDWSFDPDPIYDNGSTISGTPLPQHPYFVGFPGFGWNWQFHD